MKDANLEKIELGFLPSLRLQSEPHRLIFSPAGDKLTSLHRDPSILNLYDVYSGTRIKNVNLRNKNCDEILCLSFSKDKNLLAIGYKEGFVVWDIQNKKYK